MQGIKCNQDTATDDIVGVNIIFDCVIIILQKNNSLQLNVAFADLFSFSHFLTLFAFSDHRVPQLSQHSCLYLILDHKGSLSGVDL